MGEALPAGEKHELFTDWARGRGIEINGVAAAKFSGRGIGIAATRKIEAGEQLVKVPFSVLLTIDSVPRPFQDIHEGISVHGLLASFLAFGAPEDLETYGPWTATWPSLEDLQELMPILWPVTMTETVSSSSQLNGRNSSRHGYCPLPPDISGRWHTVTSQNSPATLNSGLLAKRKMRFEKDWVKVLSAVHDANRERYMYYWLLVNSRTFYHERPGMKHAKTPREDRMALCPFADYFNHSDVDDGCDVSSRNGSYTIMSRKAYEPGEEIYVSYGNHSNDFLLTEYGFILPYNSSDAISLDALLLPHIPSHHRTPLEEAGYLGNYTLTHHGLCYRTQIAIRTQTLSAQHWQLYVAGRDADLPDDVRKREARDADRWVWRFVLGEALREAEAVMRRFGGDDEKDEGGASKIGEDEKDYRGERGREVLVRRWAQIRDMLKHVRGSLNLGEDMI